MSLKDKEKWNSKYEVDEYITGKEPSLWLEDNADLLAKSGKALDIAGGEGRNSVFVASKGYEVTCMDISENGLRKAQALAQEKILLRLQPFSPIWIVTLLKKMNMISSSASISWNVVCFPESIKH